MHLFENLTHFSEVVLESVSPEGKPQLDSPEGRVLNPGHAIEAGWFLWQHALGEVK